MHRSDDYSVEWQEECRSRWGGGRETSSGISFSEALNSKSVDGVMEVGAEEDFGELTDDERFVRALTPTKNLER